MTNNASINIIQFIKNKIDTIGDSKVSEYDYARGVGFYRGNIQQIDTLIPGDINESLYKIIIVREPTSNRDAPQDQTKTQSRRDQTKTQSQQNPSNQVHGTVEVKNSKVFKNLQWNGQSCWFDSFLMNIFTYKTDISTKFVQNLSLYPKNIFTQFMVNLLSKTNKVMVMSSIRGIYDYCVYDSTSHLNTRGMMDRIRHNIMSPFTGTRTQLLCNDFNKDSPSSFANVAIILNNMYNLEMRIHTIALTGNERLFSDSLQRVVNTKIVQEYINDVIIFNTSSFTENKTSVNLNVSNPVTHNIMINNHDYKLGSTTVHVPGHYVSIIWDKAQNKYILVNIMGISNYSRYVTESDWQNSTFLFYYRAELLTPDNIITGLSGDASNGYTLITGYSTPDKKSGGGITQYNYLANINKQSYMCIKNYINHIQDQ